MIGCFTTEGVMDETIQANQIMGDLCDTNNILLSLNGDDSALVTEAERKAGDLSRHTYTQHEKMVLRQFEGASAPAKYLMSIPSGQKKHLVICSIQSSNDHQRYII